MNSNEKNKSFKSFILITVIQVLSAYYLYRFFFIPPDMPALDTEQWWGPYPMDLDHDKSIRPLTIEFSDVMINDLRERLLHRRPLQPPLENVGFTYGFNPRYLNQVMEYWHNKYNFKEREQFLNQYDHFVTNIQGLDIHFMHIKPKNVAGLEMVPLIMLHGWPGSFREFYDVIPYLMAEQPEQKIAFEIIVPSLPGFGYSQASVRPGLGPAEMAVIINNLMKRIGHDKYYIQGGDLGHTVGSIIATAFPENVLGFHTNFPVLLSHRAALLYITCGSLIPSLIETKELQPRLYPLSEHWSRLIEESGYMHIQATKPETVGVGLSDSPAGLAAYILEKFSTWTNPGNKKAGDGNLLKKFSLNQLLDNLMIYWATNTVTTSMRVYAESFNEKQNFLIFDRIPTNVPTWGIKFKYELMYQPDTALSFKYKKYLQSTVVEDGGHFAAMEYPELMAKDITQAVIKFQKFWNFEKQESNETPPLHETARTVYEFTVKSINGRDVKLSDYKGNVLLIVNVASQCGLTTTNYQQLNELHEKYHQKGLRILAFPCNQFNGQEPGTSKDILNFTKDRGVKFDLFEKVDVNGDNAHPLWKFLKKAQSGTIGDFIKWNFSKFLVDRNGVPVERYAPHVNPLDLEKDLAKYW